MAGSSDLVVNIDAVVIGAGVSGLVAAKCLQDDGFSVIVLERTTDLGGLWRFRENDYGVMRFTRINVSKHNYCFSDYPYPDSTPDYPHHSQTIKYIEDYARDNNVVAFIEYQVKVKSVVREGDKWRVSGCKVAEDGKTELSAKVEVLSKFLAVASGHHTKPNWPKFKGQETFSGEIIHSVDFKDSVTNNYTGQKVLVVGIGNSAVDVAVNCVTEGRCPVVHISSRSGCWVVPNYLFGYATDLYACRLFFRLPYAIRDFLFGTMVKIATGNPFRWGLNPKMKVLQTQPTVSPTLVHHLQAENIKILPNIKEIDGRRVIFEDGSSNNYDKIIFCTGYQIDLPFLSDNVKKAVLESGSNSIKLYKNVFAPEIGSSLAFIGFVQPASGGLLPMSEMQARWFSQLCKGNAQLPSKDEMNKSIANESNASKAWWYPSARHTIQKDPIPYIDDIANQIGVAPHISDFPSLGWRFWLGSCGTYQWRLKGSNKWTSAEKYVQKVPVVPFMKLGGSLLAMIILTLMGTLLLYLCGLLG